jgi:hypothetical protein
MRKAVIKGLLLVVALAAAGVAFVRFNQPTLSDGPIPIVWDSQVCADCKMHVGDPRFAAQLHTTDGDVMSFDDPGCLLVYLQKKQAAIHALYFRDYDQDGWLTTDEVGFLPVDESPMGYGIKAVSKDTPGARDLAWAKEQVMNRPHPEHGGR